MTLAKPELRAATGHSESLADRIVVAQAGGASLWMLPTEVRDVVSFRGSIETAPDLSGTDDLAQHLVVDLLDKGSRQRDRFEIAEAIEGRGAQLSFYADTLRAGFSGKALRTDLPDVMALLAEQLREPRLDADEFTKERAKAIAGVQHAMDSTSSQASGALKRILFRPDHPNYVRKLEEEIAALEALTLDEVSSFHAAHFGANGLRIAFAGDLDMGAVVDSVQAELGDWLPLRRVGRYSADSSPSNPARENIPMADRQNLDIRIGHALNVRRDDPAFLPLFVGDNVLGGNFSSRLMQTVRDRLGLTYGIGSSLAGTAVEHTGFWKIEVSLSSDNLDRGLEATLNVVREFVELGVTQAELDEKKTTLAGNHVIGLATTGGICARVLVNAERGFHESYLDDYPVLVDALTLGEVNATIATHFDPDALSIAVAGSLPAV